MPPSVQPAHLALYSDVHCPYAYLAVYPLRKLRDEYHERIVIDSGVAKHQVIEPAPCRGDGCLDILRRVLAEAEQARPPRRR